MLLGADRGVAREWPAPGDLSGGRGGGTLGLRGGGGGGPIEDALPEDSEEEGRPDGSTVDGAADPVGSGSADPAAVPESELAPGEWRASRARSTMRARRASRARFSSSLRRSAAITAVSFREDLIRVGFIVLLASSGTGLGGGGTVCRPAERRL